MSSSYLNRISNKLLKEEIEECVVLAKLLGYEIDYFMMAEDVILLDIYKKGAWYSISIRPNNVYDVFIDVNGSFERIFGLQALKEAL